MNSSGKGWGVVNAATAASALSSTQDNTVWFADVLQRLAVQGTVQPVGGKGTAQHWSGGLAVVVSGGLGMHSIVLRAAESRRGRRSVADTPALAARAVGRARNLG
jgi:hypothetical protein